MKITHHVHAGDFVEWNYQGRPDGKLTQGVVFRLHPMYIEIWLADNTTKRITPRNVRLASGPVPVELAETKIQLGGL